MLSLDALGPCSDVRVHPDRYELLKRTLNAAGVRTGFTPTMSGGTFAIPAMFGVQITQDKFLPLTMPVRVRRRFYGRRPRSYERRWSVVVRPVLFWLNTPRQRPVMTAFTYDEGAL